MKKAIDFIKKPVNLYFSIVFMFTLMTCLFGISFSYYVDDSSKEVNIKLKGIDTELTSEYLLDGEIIIPPQTTLTIPVNIKSNNEFTTDYKLFYISDSDVEVVSQDEIESTILPSETKGMTLAIMNYDEEEAKVIIDIKNGYQGSLIELEKGKEIKKIQ